MPKIGRYSAVVVAIVLSGLGGAVQAENIVDEWGSVQAPPKLELEAVSAESRTTALLMLDIIKQTCNSEKRPRCVAAVPKVKKLLEAARVSGAMVVYATVPNVPIADTLQDIAPLKDDPVIVSWVDKFSLGGKDTGLEKLLRDRGIKTVIPMGTSSNGAVLYTASEAALRDFNVVVPVDGMAANGQDTYVDQYVVYNLAHAPIISAKVTLTSTDKFTFK
jgi:nicotinamidase-related amidase